MFILKVNPGDPQFVEHLNHGTRWCFHYLNPNLSLIWTVFSGLNWTCGTWTLHGANVVGFVWPSLHPDLLLMTYACTVQNNNDISSRKEMTNQISVYFIALCGFMSVCCFVKTSPRLQTWKSTIHILFGVTRIRFTVGWKRHTPLPLLSRRPLSLLSSHSPRLIRSVISPHSG